MKTESRSLSLIARLSIMASALLLGQQALALGTDAGVTVSNQATVAYDVGGNLQTPIPSDPAGNNDPLAGSPTVFLVDRRVDFTIVVSDAVHTVVAPGDVQAFAAFSLTNLSNAIMDWDLTLVDLTSADPAVNGEDDTDVVLINYTIRVANGDGAAGVPDFGADLAFIDELGEDETVVIYVFADAPLTLVNDDVDNFTLNATAADHVTATATPGTLDDLLTQSGGADDPTIIESVFANVSGADGSGNATEGESDGFIVDSAALVITKVAVVDSAPFSSEKAIPGAIIEYTITIDNSGGDSDATNVSISDVIDSDVTLVLGAYGGAGQDIELDNGGAVSTCSADPLAGDTDGCSYDIPNLVVGNATVPITVAAGVILTVKFQVLIPNL
ncbi:MAG: hypothetical protein IIA07_07935 [Proteobacteria bacterium]|nr:hypothetical protein [Pseudomonadota bacterium]